MSVSHDIGREGGPVLQALCKLLDQLLATDQQGRTDTEGRLERVCRHDCKTTIPFRGL